MLPKLFSGLDLIAQASGLEIVIASEQYVSVSLTVSGTKLVSACVICWKEEDRYCIQVGMSPSVRKQINRRNQYMQTCTLFAVLTSASTLWSRDDAKSPT